MSNVLTESAAPSVLVVDDDDFAHDVLGEMLGQLGIASVHAAKDGRVALRVLSGLKPAPAFLICDVFMPDMDGIEFLDRLATQGFSGGIIILSGVDVEMLNLSKLIATNGGLNILGAFVKPVTLAQLSGVIGPL